MYALLMNATSRVTIVATLPLVAKGNSRAISVTGILTIEQFFDEHLPKITYFRACF
jgi:hypothetical protein